MFTVVDVAAKHLLPGVLFLLQFQQRAMETICLVRGELPIVSEVGVDTPVGVKGGDGDVSDAYDYRRTPEETCLGRGEMSFGLQCAAGDIIGTPRFTHHEIVVQYQSLTEREPVIAQGQCLQ